MNIFGTDRQTIQDLNIFNRSREDPSVFKYYNQTVTGGGKELLEIIMASPLNDLDEINTRLSAIRYIHDHHLNFGFNKEHINIIEHYLNLNIPTLRNNLIDSWFTWFYDKFRPNNAFYITNRGLEYLVVHLQKLLKFSQKLDSPGLPLFFSYLKNEIESIRMHPGLGPFLNLKRRRLSFRQVSQYDQLIRNKEKENVRKILHLTYLLDVYISLATVARDNHLGFPEISVSDRPFIEFHDIFHPFLNEPVKNRMSLQGQCNLCFVTGPNMAGKSTFLKSVGLCIYLSHLGFPVPARSLNTSLFNGIYTTINITDDLNRGYSHYYSEVKRIKDILLNIKKKKRVFVIFDELFRGTNVKDAYDATLLVTKGFTKMPDALFFISTHIVEVGRELEKLEQVSFKCLESRLEEGMPVYDYRLKDGISTERLGLVILKNEKIMDDMDEIAYEQLKKR